MAADMLLFVSSEDGEVVTPVEVPYMATAGDLLQVYEKERGVSRRGRLHFEGKALAEGAVL